MIYGQFICYVLLVFSVYVSGQENRNEQTLVRGHYSFNRPPNFEDYDPLLAVEAIEDKEQPTKALRNSVIVIRSLKDVIPEDEDIADDLLVKSNETIFNQDNRKNRIEHEPGSQQNPISAVNETNTSQENIILKRPPIKKTIKIKSRRRSQVQNSKSKVNDTIVRNYVNIEDVDQNPKEKEKIEKVGSKEKSTKENSKRSRERKPVIPIIENENFVYSHTGDFHYSYKSGDGTKAFERGELKTFEDKTAGEAVVGSFSYKDKDGNDFNLSYTADENGYRPEGAHLPTPPPIPPAIARALLYLSTKSTPQPVTESHF